LYHKTYGNVVQALDVAKTFRVDSLLSAVTFLKKDEFGLFETRKVFLKPCPKYSLTVATKEE
jgi:hypothetical protein